MLKCFNILAVSTADTAIGGEDDERLAKCESSDPTLVGERPKKNNFLLKRVHNE